ncbi:hypothetical protein ACK3TF_001355 [Chlorella vulgaris]
MTDNHGAVGHGAAAAGARAASATATATALPLTRVTVGMWTSRRHRACQMLLLEGQIVLLVDRRATIARSPVRFLGGLAAASPFSSASAAGCVHAFEIPLTSIRGLDYSNPLCLEARLVLETSGLRKREFATMEAARAYFLEPACPAHRNSIELRCSSAALDRPPSGQLHAALQAQAPPEPVPVSAGEREFEFHPLPDSRRRRSSSNRARASLALRLDGTQDGGSGGSGGMQSSKAEQQQQPQRHAHACAAPAGCTKPLAIVASPAGGPAAAAAGHITCVVGATGAVSEADAASEGATSEGTTSEGAVTPRRRDSLEGEEPEFESEFGSQWYWGSPAHSSASPPSVASQAVQAAQAAASAAAAAAAGSSPAGGGGAAAGGGREQEEPAMLVGSAPSASFARQTDSGGGGSAVSPPPPTLQRAASEGHLPSAKQPSKLRQPELQQEAGLGGGGEVAWPAAHAFTAVSRVYSYRTVCINWTDPRLPGLLRPVVQHNERLLKLYESGLPSWAVYAPQFGLFYRPWLRTVTWVLFYAFSVFSFVIGFYDLLKAVPGLQVVARQLMARMWLPPVAVLEWLEQHTQIRLSILATYLFGKSEAFVWVMRWVHNFARVTRAALQPVVAALGPPVAVVGQAIRLVGGQAWQALAAVGLSLSAVLQAGLGPVAALLLQCWGLLCTALLPLGQALWLTVLPADALEVLRTSAVKAAKSAQAVGKFFLHLCSSAVRHRLTLSLKAGRAWRRTKGRLAALATAPLLLLAELLKWLIITARLLFIEHGKESTQQPAQPAQQAQQAQQRQHTQQQRRDQAIGPASVEVAADWAPPPPCAAGGTLVHRRAAAASGDDVVGGGSGI